MLNHEKKLVNANRRSRIDTLFQSLKLLMNVRFLVKQGYLAMLTDIIPLKPYCKEAIIILSSEGKIAFNNHKIVLIKKN